MQKLHKNILIGTSFVIGAFVVYKLMTKDKEVKSGFTGTPLVLSPQTKCLANAYAAGLESPEEWCAPLAAKKANQSTLSSIK